MPCDNCNHRLVDHIPEELVVAFLQILNPAGVDGIVIVFKDGTTALAAVPFEKTHDQGLNTLRHIAKYTTETVLENDNAAEWIDECDAYLRARN